jgi:ADP-ribose pyrophosphatase YjhB (NUDIX family)
MKKGGEKGLTTVGGPTLSARPDNFGQGRPPPCHGRTAPREESDEDRPVLTGPRVPTKTSIGIILCRRNVKTGRPEVLLAHKRYTYAFAEFVHGRYARGRASFAMTLRNITPLFDLMTREELFDVLSLNFEQMWYRIWLTLDNRDLYNKKYAKFQSTFMREDGGAALRRLVMLARATGVLLWEVPRGRHLNAREADSLCASRELHEETGVEKSEYRFLPGVKRRVSHVSAGTRYVCAYYIALANPHLANADGYDDPSRPTLRDLSHMAEVSEVRWHDIERVRLIDSSDSRLEALVAPAFNLIKQYLKGRWASRRPVIAPPTTAVLPPAAGAARAPEEGWRPAQKGARASKFCKQNSGSRPRPPRGEQCNDRCKGGAKK